MNLIEKQEVIDIIDELLEQLDKFGHRYDELPIFVLQTVKLRVEELKEVDE